MGLFQITIWATHLNNGISISANEIACNLILKKIYNTHWHSDRILSGILNQLENAAHLPPQRLPILLRPMSS